MRILPQKKRGILSLDGIHFYVGKDTPLVCVSAPFSTIQHHSATALRHNWAPSHGWPPRAPVEVSASLHKSDDQQITDEKKKEILQFHGEILLLQDLWIFVVFHGLCEG